MLHILRPSLLLLGSLLFSAFFSPAQADSNLRFSCAYMDRHPAYINGFAPWMLELENASQGRIKLTYYSPNTLCPEAGMFDALSAGVLDIASNAHGRTPGRFPLIGVLDLPMIVPDARSGSIISQELYDSWPVLQEESAGPKLLWHYVSAPHVLHSKKPIKSLEDLNGMKIIAWAPLAVEVLKALGANPIQSVPHDSYLAVQRGMADGVLCPLSTLRSFKISEALSYTLTTPLMVDSFWVGMSQSSWDKLGPEDKALLEASLLAMPEVMGHALDDGAASEAAILAESGHHFHSLSQEELALWREALAPLYDVWLVDMAARGLEDAPALLQDLQHRAASLNSPAQDHVN